MTAESAEHREPSPVEPFSPVGAAIRIGLLGLLLYWSLKVIGPFLTVALWSAIITVALYPFFKWFAWRLGGRERLAATLLTLFCLLIVLGPVTWLGLGLVDGVEFAARGLESGAFSLPKPPEWVKSWPLIGERAYDLWTSAAADLKAALLDLAPSLKPLAGKLLGIAGSVGFGILELIASIVIAGFLYRPGPQMAILARAFLGRIIGGRSGEMLTLAGSTIRKVSQGVVGIALMQSLCAGVGFLIAGIPAAAFLTLFALVLGIVQIGPAALIIPIVVWSWIAMDTTSALLFTAYMIPVSLIDNIVKPFVMARGLTTPMPIIIVGVFGGTIAYGISGLFLGPLVLAVAWALIVAWVKDEGTRAGTGVREGG